MRLRQRAISILPLMAPPSRLSLIRRRLSLMPLIRAAAASPARRRYFRRR